MDYECRNPVRISESAINLELNHPVYGWIPFTASPDDVELHGREIYEAAARGDYGEVQEAEQS